MRMVCSPTSSVDASGFKEKHYHTASWQNSLPKIFESHSMYFGLHFLFFKYSDLKMPKSIVITLLLTDSEFKYNKIQSGHFSAL